jgi:SAM-dependent methyltransferase
VKGQVRRAGARLFRRFTVIASEDPEAFLRHVYQKLLGRTPDVDGLAAYTSQLRQGRSPIDVVIEVARSKEAVKQGARRHHMAVDERTDDEYIADVYRDVLGRELDEPGRQWMTSLARSGTSRQGLVTMVALSEESLNRQWAQRIHIQDLHELRPASFRSVPGPDGNDLEVFRADTAADFDWLERAILDYGYYEKPGIWSLELDEDKRRMARLLSVFRPQRTLEIGCSSGAVIQQLVERGYDSEGLEISSMAIARAHDSVRGRITRGDLLDVTFAHSFDLVFGLDVFEHLNPNRFHLYVKKLREIVAPGGFLFVNSPAFGEDVVWGNVFPIYVDSWRQDVAAGRPFRDLHVDAEGYPHHGHLIWASPRWWTEQFSTQGFVREIEIEKALHRIYDADFEREAMARKAFFVFSLDASPQRIADVIRNVS